MKKLILGAAALAIFTTTKIQAQDEVSFGVKGGVNFATISGDGIDDPDARTSFNLGAFVEIPVSERLSIQPEVLYSGQGYDIASNEDADDVEFQLDYINVPVMAKVYVIEGLYAEVGPQIGFNVKSTIDGDPDDQDSGDVNLDDDAFNDIDFGVGLGAGYKLNNGLALTARYTLGLSDVFNSDELGGLDINARNRVFAVGAAFSF